MSKADKIRLAIDQGFPTPARQHGLHFPHICPQSDGRTNYTYERFAGWAPPRRLRVLIVDGHTAPMSEASLYLQRYTGAVVQTVSFYGYVAHRMQSARLLSNRTTWCLADYFETTCSRPGKFIDCIEATLASPPTAQGKGNASHAPATNLARQRFKRTFGREIEDAFDVVLCQFPGWQCSLFDELRVAIAVRFTHRFDHHVWSRYGQRSKDGWDRMLLRWHLTGRAAIFADNGYDAAYLWHELRAPSTAWPAIGLKALRGKAGTAAASFASHKPTDDVTASASPASATAANESYLRTSNGTAAGVSDASVATNDEVRTAGFPAAAGAAAATDQWCWCCWKEWDARSTTRYLMARMQARVPHAPIRMMKSVLVAKHGPTLAQSTNCTAFGEMDMCTAHVPRPARARDRQQAHNPDVPFAAPHAVLIPHSLHSYGSVEAYAAGLPLLVPSPALIAKWHALYAIIEHRGPGNHPWIHGAPLGSDGVHASEPDMLERWAATVDFLHWPL